MDKGKSDALKALIERTRAHQAEFAARNPGFLANEEAELKRATDAAQPITEAASKRLIKKKSREFTTFIEKSQPPER